MILAYASRGVEYATSESLTSSAGRTGDGCDGEGHGESCKS